MNFLPELRVQSAFSFLEGASLPEALMARAAELEIPAVTLCSFLTLGTVSMPATSSIGFSWLIVGWTCEFFFQKRESKGGK